MGSLLLCALQLQLNLLQLDCIRLELGVTLGDILFIFADMLAAQRWAVGLPGIPGGNKERAIGLPGNPGVNNERAGWTFTFTTGCM